jgi:peptide/nickel transport system permease protein
MVEKNKEYVQAARVIGVRRCASWCVMCCRTCRAGAGDRHDQPRPRPSSPRRRCRSWAWACRRPPSLGTLIRVGNDFLFSGEWWITVFPGRDAGADRLSVNLLGDWLRDALNPKLR